MARSHDTRDHEAARRRQRAYRQRQKRGMRVVPVEIDFNAIDNLESLGLLEPWSEDNSAAVGKAINDALAALFELVADPQGGTISALVRRAFAEAKRRADTEDGVTHNAENFSDVLSIGESATGAKPQRTD